jgi:hypothetical protein
LELYSGVRVKPENCNQTSNQLCFVLGILKITTEGGSVAAGQQQGLFLF